jgi:peptide/nickel transport system permease protein
LRSILRRVLQLIVVLIVVTFFVAVLLEFLPGDPVKTIAPFASEQQREAITEELGLDEPLPQRYVEWLGGFLTGDLGNYYRGPQVVDPVANDAWDGLGVSLQLMIYVQILTLAVAIPLGIFTAYRAAGVFDRATNTGAFAFISIPNFVLAFALTYWLGVRLGWFPVSGYVPFGSDPREHFNHMFLPAVTLAMGQIAVYTRLLRSDMIATLQEDFILMAKSKGISNSRILWRHALRPSSLTLLTVAGLNVGTLIGGAVIIERIFGLPGLGKQIFDAIGARQYIAVQSLVAIIAIAYVLINFFVDILYTVLDPRIRHARALG